MIKTREGFWVVAALAIAAGACSKSKAGGPDPAGGGGGAPMGMPVEVVVARMDTVRDEISATGQIEAVQSIDLRPEVDGRIVEILIREGQEVDQGTPLFKVDDAQLKAQVAQLEAQRDLAQQALARAKDLAQQNASSTADLEKAFCCANRKSTRLNSSHLVISYAVFCLKKKKTYRYTSRFPVSHHIVTSES